MTCLAMGGLNEFLIDYIFAVEFDGGKWEFVDSKWPVERVFTSLGSLFLEAFALLSKSTFSLDYATARKL